MLPLGITLTVLLVAGVAFLVWRSNCNKQTREVFSQVPPPTPKSDDAAPPTSP